ncbi:gluzincin family metallopeptidase [Alkaliphilus crotonatoxidans]
MKNAFFSYETKRILKSKFTKIIILLASVFPLICALLSPYINEDISILILGINSSTRLSQTILFPAKAGAVLSSLAFIALTVFEFDKILRFRVNYIIEPISSSIKINLTKITGLMCAGLISTVGSMIIMIPHYIFNIGSLTNFNYFLLSYFLIILGSIVLAILMTAGFYLIFRNVNITCIIMFLSVLFSFLAGNIDYQYMWVQTGASGLSENFGNGNIVFGMLWNRLFGFLVAMSIFLFGMLCDRCYEKGLFKSLFKNCKKYKLLPICFLVSILGVFFVYQNEPIFKSLSLTDAASMLISGKNETPVNLSVIGTSNMFVDLKIEKDKNFAAGAYCQELQNSTNEPQNIYFELADGYHINEIKLDNVDINYKQVSPKIINSAKLSNVFEISIPKNTKAKLDIRYSGTPKALSVVKDFSKGINKNYVNLGKAKDIAPVLCVEQNDRIIKGTIEIDSKFTVITQGDKNRKISEHDGVTAWSFSYDKLSDLSLIAGRYGIFERNVSGTDVEFFYPLAASKEFKSRGNDTLDIFSFFSEIYGPLGGDSLKVVITSGVHGGNGSQIGNISYISEDCLTKKSNVDSAQASSSDTFALLTHEIAHQWWGGGIDASNKNSDNQIDQNHDEWSNEAFAEISAYLFLKNKFGENYAQNLLLKKWKEEANDLNRNFYRRNPEYMNKLSMIPKYNVSLFLRGNKLYGLGPLTVYNVYNYIGEDNYFNSMKVIYKEYYDKNDKKLSFSEFLNITGVTEEVAVNGY